MTPRRAVAVIGPGDTSDAALIDAAERIGSTFAREGLVVVTGGRDGVMAAASRGAASAGGTVVGVLPDEIASTANEWVDVAVPTGMGEARDVLVVRAADVVVAVGGSWGTLAEVALARRMGKPVVWLHGWAVDGPPAGDGVETADDADAATAAALRLLG